MLIPWNPTTDHFPAQPKADNNIGTLIKEKHEQFGINPSESAERIGVSVGTIRAGQKGNAVTMTCSP